MKTSVANIKQILLVLIFAFVISFFITTPLKMLDSDILIMYIGVLIGFAITIYTFGLTFFPQIAEQIRSSEKIKEHDKEPTFNSLVDGYSELKEDVWAIAMCLIGIILVAFIEGLGYNYIKTIQVGYSVMPVWNLITFFKLSFFCLATRAYWDLVKSLLSISSIIIETTKKNGVTKS